MSSAGTKKRRVPSKSSNGGSAGESRVVNKPMKRRKSKKGSSGAFSTVALEGDAKRPKSLYEPQVQQETEAEDDFWGGVRVKREMRLERKQQKKTQKLTRSKKPSATGIMDVPSDSIVDDDQEEDLSHISQSKKKKQKKVKRHTQKITDDSDDDEDEEELEGYDSDDDNLSSESESDDSSDDEGNEQEKRLKRRSKAASAAADDDDDDDDEQDSEDAEEDSGDDDDDERKDTNLVDSIATVLNRTVGANANMVPILAQRTDMKQKDAERTAKAVERKIEREMTQQRKDMRNKNHLAVSYELQDNDKEKKLKRLATKGVVQLFNAINKQQKGREGKQDDEDDERIGDSKGAIRDHSKEEEQTKSNFMGLLKDGKSSSTSSQKGWSALSDDSVWAHKAQDESSSEEDSDMDY
eukprot:TRINITY_DN110_c1_g1_i1.p1 TRINITY_DN110_c1_g1~~TRINITY_DN110_c1_g1_i1.p1  ORF type:complete len:410 (+),score=157.34 TRINITY_DN110_c1_g1_i1:150-1379(+)